MGNVIKLVKNKYKDEEPIQKLLSLIENDFVRVNNLINEQVISQVDRIPDVSNHIIELGGKRLRPILTLTTSKICQYKGDMHIKLAAAVELMHTATLLHDDVVDDSDFRRGKSASHIVWDNKSSILVGDFHHLTLIPVPLPLHLYDILRVGHPVPDRHRGCGSLFAWFFDPFEPQISF